MSDTGTGQGPPAPPPQPSPATKGRRALGGRVGVWTLSIAAVVIIPMLPLLVEARKNAGVVKEENYLLTAAVLAAGFGFTSEGNFFRAAYILVFLACIVFDQPDAAAGATLTGPATVTAIQPSPLVAFASAHSAWAGDAIGWILDHAALDMVLAVAVLQAIERFVWHVVLDRRFPDWLKGS